MMMMMVRNREIYSLYISENFTEKYSEVELLYSFEITADTASTPDFPSKKPSRLSGRNLKSGPRY